MVAVPILALLNPILAPVPQLLTVLPLTVAMAWSERHAIDVRGLAWLLAGRVPGAAIGVVLLAFATQQFLDFFIGLVVLAAVATLSLGLTVRINRGTQFGAGIASGATSLVASIGGPPTALLYSRETAPTIRATLAAVFTIGVAFTVVVRFVTGNVAQSDLAVAVALFPAVLVGWLVSTRYRDRLSQHRVRLGVLAISGAAALGLIIRAIAG
jgi:hypothetical protein